MFRVVERPFGTRRLDATRASRKSQPRAPRRVGEDRIVSLPNVVTTARLVLVPVFVWLLLQPHHSDWFHAAVLRAALGSTDWLDGHLARRLDQVTILGKVLDPTADRVLLATAGDRHPRGRRHTDSRRRNRPDPRGPSGYRCGRTGPGRGPAHRRDAGRQGGDLRAHVCLPAVPRRPPGRPGACATVAQPRLRAFRTRSLALAVHAVRPERHPAPCFRLLRDPWLAALRWWSGRGRRC